MKANLAVYNNGNKGDDSGSKARTRGKIDSSWSESRDEAPF